MIRLVRSVDNHTEVVLPVQLRSQPVSVINHPLPFDFIKVLGVLTTQPPFLALVRRFGGLVAILHTHVALGERHVLTTYQVADA